jgi:hypothetical protein
MTLIQASLCANNEVIILIGDRMTTITLYELEYEVEGYRSKLYSFGPHAVGFSGAEDDIKDVLIKLRQSKPPDKVEEFVECVSDAVEAVNDEEKESIIQRYTLRSLDDFKKDTYGEDRTIPNDLKDAIYGELGESLLDLDALVIGFNKENKGRIFTVNEFGAITDQTDEMYANIGSGEAFSEIFFDQASYSSTCSLEKGLLSAYHAKKLAEHHPGVGSKTDIVILQKGQDNITLLDGCPQIANLDECLKAESEAIDKFRDQWEVWIHSKIIDYNPAETEGGNRP